MKVTYYITTIISAIMLVSCSNKALYDDDTNAKSVSSYLGSENVREQPYLKIKSEAFEHDFLFYATFIPMLESPSGHSLKGRIVRFIKGADKVLLAESSVGHTIGDLKDTTILLAEFPIVKNDNDGVVIDFARGMNNAFTTRNVHTSTQAEDNKIGEQFRAISLNGSYIKAIESDHDVLTITQVAQWRNVKGELISSEFLYNLRDYEPSPAFKKKKYGKNRHTQFFSSPPQILGSSSEQVAYIAKWHIAKPIIFYVSANTPEPYRQPIKDGILFWNHIFGRPVFEVRDLDEGVKAPHPRLNIVQWVSWDNEASAYADMVMDHQSGQILQAQIYVRSGWVMTSGRKLRTQLEKLMLDDPASDGQNKGEEQMPLPDMFDYDEPCFKNLAHTDALADLAGYLNAIEISDETLKILSGDIIRAVLAHEMGHILGLRHNLASSTAGNLSLDERHHMLKSYLKTAEPPLGDTKFLTKSIMDVFSAADDALMGSQIRVFISDDIEKSRLRKLYQYDQEAIGYGYFDKIMPGNSPFCTDEDIPRYLDCRRWDVSDTPLLYAASKVNSGPSYVAMVFAETFMSAIDPERAGGPIAFRDVPINSLKVLKTMGSNAKELFAWFNADSRSVQIDSRYPALGPQNQAQINEAKWQSISEQIKQKGLTTTLFSVLPPFKAANLKSEALAHTTSVHMAALARESQQKNPHFSFSDKDLKEVKTIADGFFSTLNKNLDTLMALVISQSQFDHPTLQLGFEEALGQVAKELILRREQNAANDNKPPSFFYPMPTRQAGTQMLSPTVGMLSDWSYDTTALITSELKTLMQRYGTADIEGKIDLRAMPRPYRQWMFDQNNLLSILARIKTLQRPSPAPTL